LILLSNFFVAISGINLDDIQTLKPLIIWGDYMKNSNPYRLKLVAVAVAGAFTASPAFAAEDVARTDKIEVISTTPLPGIGLPANKVPANVQTTVPAEINNQAGTSLAVT
jgi:hypothetical protein